MPRTRSGMSTAMIFSSWRRAKASIRLVSVAPRWAAWTALSSSDRAMRRLRRQALAHQRQAAEDDHQQVVEIMGDAAGQLPDRLQLLRLEQGLAGLLQLLLRLQALGDVAGHLGEAGQGSGIVADRVDDHMRPEPRPVLADPPSFLLESPDPRRRSPRLTAGSAGRPVLIRVEAGEMLADDLRRRVALDALGPGIPTADPALGDRACRWRSRSRPGSAAGTAPRCARAPPSPRAAGRCWLFSSAVRAATRASSSCGHTLAGLDEAAHIVLPPAAAQRRLQRAGQADRLHRPLDQGDVAQALDDVQAPGCDRLRLPVAGEKDEGQVGPLRLGVDPSQQVGDVPAHEGPPRRRRLRRPRCPAPPAAGRGRCRSLRSSPTRPRISAEAGPSRPMGANTRTRWLRGSGSIRPTGLAAAARCFRHIPASPTVSPETRKEGARSWMPSAVRRNSRIVCSWLPVRFLTTERARRTWPIASK